MIQSQAVRRPHLAHFFTPLALSILAGCTPGAAADEGSSGTGSTGETGSGSGTLGSGGNGTASLTITVIPEPASLGAILAQAASVSAATLNPASFR